MTNPIPEVVILRLPLYSRVLAELEERGEEVVSSQTLGRLLHSTPAQIRKDLAYFGEFGVRGVGYYVTELRRHLGLLDADLPVRHLKMRVGRMSKIWHRNCVAVGLSQGFIEPLEATGIVLIEAAVGMLAERMMHKHEGIEPDRDWIDHSERVIKWLELGQDELEAWDLELRDLLDMA